MLFFWLKCVSYKLTYLCYIYSSSEVTFFIIILYNLNSIIYRFHTIKVRRIEVRHAVEKLNCLSFWFQSHCPYTVNCYSMAAINVPSESQWILKPKQWKMLIQALDKNWLQLLHISFASRVCGKMRSLLLTWNYFFWS